MLRGTGWELWLALRYVFSKKKERFTSIISIIAIIGVALSVASLIVVNAVMVGFKQAVVEKILSLNPHITIDYLDKNQAPEIVKLVKKIIPASELKSVEKTATFQGMLITDAGSVGIMLKGIHFDSLKKEKQIILKIFNIPSDKTKIPVIIGKKLAERFGIVPGENLKFLSVQGTFTPFGFFPKVIPLKVKGVFSTGIYDYDTGIVFAPYNLITKRLTPSYYAIEVKLKDPFKAHFYKERIQSALGFGTATVMDWQEWNRNFFAALKMERLGLFVVLTLMIIVSLFTIIAAMTMLVNDKKKDIAILRAFGTPSGGILRIFFFCGFILSLIGVGIGLVLGCSLCEFLAHYPIIKLPSEVYPVEYMPVALRLQDVILISGLAVLISVVACLYPAKKASQTVPVEVLRDE